MSIKSFSILAGLAMLAMGAAPASSSEVVYAPFSQAGGGVTTGAYEGTVSVTISGLGQALAGLYSDAFYLVPTAQSPIATHVGYWDLAFGTSTLTGNSSQEASNFIVGAIPAFSPSNIYSFNLNTGASVPTLIYTLVWMTISSPTIPARTPLWLPS